MDDSPTIGAAPAGGTTDDRRTLEMLFDGPGEMRARCRTFDWSTSPLGPFSRWPASLRTVAGLVLAAPQPMWIGWGTEFTQIYNDACAAATGDAGRSPGMLGRPARETWADVWSALGPDLAAAVGGRCRVREAHALFLRPDSDTSGSSFTCAYSPVPDPAAPSGVGGVLVVGFETTARVQALGSSEAASRRDRYRVALSDALRPLAHPFEVQATAARLLGEHLAVTRVAYGEVADDDQHIDFARSYVAPGAQVVTGRFRMADYGEALLAALRRGQPLVIADLATSDVLTAAERDGYARLGIAALVGVPLVKDGRLVANLNVHHGEPRAWTDDEIALIHETADRTWAAVERARVEQALRRREQQLRLALDAAGAATWSEDLLTGGIELDVRLRERLGVGGDGPTSLAPFIDAVHPDDRPAVVAAIDAVRAPDGPSGWDVEHRLIGPDRRVTWHQSVALTERDAAGRPVRVSAILIDITARKAAEHEVERSHAALQRRAAELEQRTRQLSRLATDLTLSEQQARERLARTLHDGLQQLLFSARLRVIGVQPSRLGPREITAALDRAVADLDEAIVAARSLSVELFPPALHERGLPAALDWLAGWVQTKYDLRVRVTTDPAANPARDDLRVLLFESVRELLFNIVKHVGTDAEASVALTVAGDDALCIAVSDNGPGIDEAALERAETPHGFGLFSIRERLSLLGGRLEVDRGPNGGARLRLIAPRHAGPAGPVAGPR